MLFFMGETNCKWKHVKHFFKNCAICHDFSFIEVETAYDKLKRL